jgi:ABC-2 type transport system ATP-binding protein
MIEVKNITKRFGPVVAVNGVSFSMSKGEVLGFLGPNGAGKSTTMRILTCFMHPEAGTATVAGYDIFENSIEIRKRVGYLPENAPLYMDLCVFDYLQYIAEIRNIPKARRRERIAEMADVCGLKSVIHRTVGELSRGFRQRVGLAQAMIHDPEILILDEPTIGLDPNQIIEIRQLIKKIGREKTILLSTHILPEVSATCGRVIIISGGKIVASGTPEELQSRAAGGTIHTVGVRAPEEEALAKLRDLKGVKEVRKIGLGESDHIRYSLKSGDGSTSGEDIFKLAVESRWSVNEIHAEKLSLEDIFKELTTKEE